MLADQDRDVRPIGRKRKDQLFHPAKVVARDEHRPRLQVEADRRPPCEELAESLVGPRLSADKRRIAGDDELLRRAERLQQPPEAVTPHDHPVELEAPESVVDDR